MDDTYTTVGLRAGFERYDFAFPQVPPERAGRAPIDPTNLVPFHGRADRSSTLGQSARRTAATGPAAFAASSYEDFLAWLARRVDPLPTRHDRLVWYLALPRQRASIAALDAYIRTRLFDRPFDPDGGRWRLLLQPAVIEHVARAFANRDRRPEQPQLQRPRWLSEVRTIDASLRALLAVDKCIYTHLPVAARDGDGNDGDRDRAFIAWVQGDLGVQAFCRIDADHDFVRVPYARVDGTADAAVPDFLVRMAAATYLVELHPRRPTVDEHPRRRAIVGWCERANALPSAQRGGMHWYYAPLGNTPVPTWRGRNPHLGDALACAQWHAHYLARARD